MIEPPKATKGRRMSKKTRKKSPKSAPGKATRAASKTSAKKPAAKSARATAKKARKGADKKPRKAASGASHKPPSKPLKSAPPAESAPQKAATPKASTGHPSALAEGVRAPGFRLPRDGGETVSLADFSGRKLVLFFYPRADTPGCTKEAIDFTRRSGAFAQSGTAVLGVSGDPLKAQESFRDKHQLSMPLASDETHEMLESYGVWGEKSMYGKTFLGIIRTTVLIGADGRIAKIWRHVKVDGHADEVLEAARAL
jgi:peroxiredoxin Q/BCP